MTFCDGKPPQLINGLISDESDFRPILELIQEPWYLKFNNSAFFTPKENEFDELFWKLGIKSFEEFIKKIHTLQPKSLTLTKEVLDKRKKLNTTVEGLIPLLNTGLSQLDNIRQQLEVIESEKKKIEGSKNFKISTNVPTIKKINLKPGEYVTNCLTCNYTCHYPCYIKDDNKFCCDAMFNGKCTVCPKKCRHNEHKNANFRLEVQIKKQITTLRELEKKYYDSKSNLSKYEQIKQGMCKEFNQIKLKCLKIQEEIKMYVNRLKEIALDSNIYSSTEYVELLIENEKNKKKPGWQGRIKGLEELKQLYETIKLAYEAKNNNITTFDEYCKKYLNQEIQKEFQKEDYLDNCLIY